MTGLFECVRDQHVATRTRACIVRRHGDGIQRRQRCRWVLAVEEQRLGPHEARRRVRRVPLDEHLDQSVRVRPLAGFSRDLRLVVEARHEQAPNVLRVARANPNATGIRVHEVPAVFGCLEQHEDAGDTGQG
ncbi:MAG: hypothetical protein JF602_08505 [Gemmatimonadetes bacterium]|nr:hypothetical protein [Gemmatimonadota bacterium]